MKRFKPDWLVRDASTADFRCCGNCIYWVTDGTEDDAAFDGNEQEYYGECRRFPPSVVPGTFYSKVPECERLGVHPEVISIYWCGEHRLAIELVTPNVEANRPGTAGRNLG